MTLYGIHGCILPLTSSLLFDITQYRKHINIIFFVPAPVAIDAYLRLISPIWIGPFEANGFSLWLLLSYSATFAIVKADFHSSIIFFSIWRKTQKKKTRMLVIFSSIVPIVSISNDLYLCNRYVLWATYFSL